MANNVAEALPAPTEKPNNHGARGGTSSEGRVFQAGRPPNPISTEHLYLEVVGALRYASIPEASGNPRTYQ